MVDHWGDAIPRAGRGYFVCLPDYSASVEGGLKKLFNGEMLKNGWVYGPFKTAKQAFEWADGHTDMISWMVVAKATSTVKEKFLTATQIQNELSDLHDLTTVKAAKIAKLLQELNCPCEREYKELTDFEDAQQWKFVLSAESRKWVKRSIDHV